MLFEIKKNIIVLWICILKNTRTKNILLIDNKLFFFNKKISYKILIIFSYKCEVIFSEYFSKYKETPQILVQKLSFTKSSQY